MASSEYFLKNLWRWKCGMPELPERDGTLQVPDLYKSEWCPEFEKYMRNRRVQASYRYGKANEQGKPRYDRCNTMRKKIALYEQTGNKEMLVDLAVYAMVEFEEPTLGIPTFFEALDDVSHDKPKA